MRKVKCRGLDGISRTNISKSQIVNPHFGWRCLLSHPSLIPLVGIVTKKDVITGFDAVCLLPLADLIHDTPPPCHRSSTVESMLHDIGRDLLEGLCYLHQNAFLHRDIKPENVLILNGRACHADFGLATVIPEGPCYNTGEVHTQLYRAPELWDITSPKTSYGPEVDVYAMGVTLTCMYLGTRSMSHGGGMLRLADRSDNPYRSIHKVIDSEPTVPRHALLLMTSHKPSVRPSADEVVRNWTSITQLRNFTSRSRATRSFRKGIHRFKLGDPIKYAKGCKGSPEEVSRECYMVAHLLARKSKQKLADVRNIAAHLVTYDGLAPSTDTWKSLLTLCMGGIPKRMRKVHTHTKDNVYKSNIWRPPKKSINMTNRLSHRK